MPKATKTTSKAKVTKKTATKKVAPTKPAKTKAGPAATKKLSALDAAAQVLAEQGGSMSTKELIETMAAKKLWESPNGKTPAATLYAAILREISAKGKDSRFQKTEPGQFAATAAAGSPEDVPAPAPKAPAAKTPKLTKGKAAKKKPAKKGTEPAPETTIPDGTPGPESLQELFRL